jgi:adenylate cyclase
LIPHLALASVLRYLQVKPQDVTIVPGKYLLLRNAQFPETKTVKDIKIPVDKLLQLRINYPSSSESHSFADILEAEEQPEWNDFWKKELQGHICTIGYVVSGTGDIGPNPIETDFSLAFIHSAIMNTILSENFLYDTGWKTNIGIALILVLVLAFIAPKLSPLRFTLAVVFLITGYIVITIVLFMTYGVILKLLNPVLIVLIAYTVITGYWYAAEEQERKYLRSAFKTYVSKQMLTKILENPKSLALQGQRKELTMLFSDIKAFSTLSDKIEPDLVHRLLNLYFSRMTNIVFKYDGFVDKFIGDGLLCFFGDPIPHPDHALRAVRTALEMQQEVRALAPQIREKFGLDPIHIRIGINTGYVIVGNMGSSERMDYTVLGSDVNLAQRLETSARPDHIMISERTYQKIQGKIEARKLSKIIIKGFENPVQVYEVVLPFE